MEGAAHALDTLQSRADVLAGALDAADQLLTVNRVDRLGSVLDRLSEPQHLDRLLDLMSEQRLDRLLSLAVDDRIDRLLDRLDVLLVDHRVQRVLDRTDEVLGDERLSRLCDRLDRLLTEDHLAQVEVVLSDGRPDTAMRVFGRLDTALSDDGTEALSTLLDRLPDLLTTDRIASLSALVDEAPRLVRGIETVPTMRDSLERHSARRPASYEGLLAYHASMPGEWTFLSNHGHVLVCLAGDPDARMRDVAELVGITERAVQQIVGDLVAQGYLTKEKVGRRNQYEVVRGAHLRHELEAHVTLGDFVGLVVDGEASVGRRRGPRSSR